MMELPLWMILILFYDLRARSLVLSAHHTSRALPNFAEPFAKTAEH